MSLAEEFEAAVGRPVLAEQREDWWGQEGGFIPARLGEYAEQVGRLRRGPGGSLWRYVDGVYVDDGDEWLSGFVRDELGDAFRRHRLTEVRAWCLANTSAKISPEPPADVINVANGLLHWRETPPRLEPHDPDKASFIQIPVKWDPDARCPRIYKVLRRVLSEDDFDAHFDFLMEWIGHLLVPRNRYKKALLLDGPGDCGKSTVMRVVESFLGPPNVSHAALQSIADDRFGPANLFGKLANISADLDAKTMKSTGMFKMLTGDDTVMVERKFRDAFSARLFARLMFSANEVPGTGDQTDAYYSRWIILPMRRRVPVDEQQPNLIDELTTPAELSGLLLHAVGHLKRLTERGRFHEPAAVTQAGQEYRLRTDTVRAFVEERCELEPEARTKETELYEDYKGWCDRSGKHPLARANFKEHLGDVFPAVEWRKKYNGYPTWFGITSIASSG